MHDLERRAQAVRATLSHWQGKPFAYGAVDCVKVGAWHLRQMGHHLTLGLAKAGTYRSAKGAKRALTRAGHDSVAAALLTAGLEQIPLAMALPGDLVLAEGSHGLESVGILIGNGAIAGFHEDAPDAGLQVIRLNSFAPVEAWRA